MNSKLLFAVGLFFCLTPWATPPLALLAGLIFGAIATHPYKDESRRLSRVLLQSAVVGLGFGMNLQEVLHAGRSGFLYTALSIAFAMVVGTFLGKLILVPPRSAFLISTGTAICGGSAIAAVGPITGATEDEMSVSLGTIFVLELGRIANVPCHRRLAEALADAIRTLGCIGDPRHQFRGRRGGKIWHPGPGRRYHCEAGPRPLDCSVVNRNGRGQAQQNAYSMALVHLVFLPCGRGEYILLPWSG